MIRGIIKKQGWSKFEAEERQASWVEPPEGELKLVHQRRPALADRAEHTRAQIGEPAGRHMIV